MMRITIGALAAALVFLLPHLAAAQTSTSADQSQLLKPEQLDALVAPIALYPDTLLAQVLMASTYPLEVVEAERWAQANKNLTGADLKTAVDKQAWDESVKSLAATPSVLEMMSTKLDWTQQLGNAVLAQQPDVMDAIQRLRTKAQANNKLASNQQQTVTTQQQDGKQVIAIAPAQSNTVYVPYYDPSVAYGPWPYPAYPPYYFGYPGYIAAGVIATGIAFGAAYAIGRWASGGYGWGGSINWNNNNININRGGNWTHNPAHRQGVRYANANVAQKFGGNRGNVQNRMDFRGRGGQQVLRPGGGDRGNLGAGAGGRPSAGTRPSGGRQGAGNRPGGGGRPSAGTRPSGGRGGRPGGGNALGNISSGRVANLQGARGRASFGGGGGFRGRGGFGGRGGGGFGGRGGGRGGRRSDFLLKHDIAIIGHLDNGIGLYRFVYNGGHKLYVGVIAQEVQAVRPDAVMRGRDGYLRVFYDRLGVPFETYDAWLASGGRMPRAVAH